MIKAELVTGNEGIEILLDSSGIDELIDYLKSIREENDHMHLIVGNELSEEPSEEGYATIKHIKLIYIDQNFGISVNSHNNIKAFDLAVENLNKTGYKLNKKEKEMLNNKNAMRNKFINNLKDTYYLNNTKD